MKKILATIITTSLCGACAVDDVATSDLEDEVVSSNGVSLNGVSLNGVSLNGVSLNGASLSGVSLAGVSSSGSSLSGTSLNGSTVKPSNYVGSTWTGYLPDGTTLALRIDSGVKGTSPNADVGMYGFSYNTSSGWQPLCGTDASGVAIQAIAVAGVWNLNLGTAGGGAYSSSTTRFTLACRAKTIAKCVELGYKPWLNRTTQLAACVRMLRGDYCGDGTAYTKDGQQVNLYDNLGIQTDTQAWGIEAEWTANGARCITAPNETRLFNTTSTGNPVPPCIQQHVVPTLSTCGTSFASGAIIIDEIQGLK